MHFFASQVDNNVAECNAWPAYCESKNKLKNYSSYDKFVINVMCIYLTTPFLVVTFETVVLVVVWSIHMRTWYSLVIYGGYCNAIMFLNACF